MGNARNLGSFLGTNTSLSTINNAYAAGTLVPSSTNPSVIINGAMRIAQRGTSATGIGAGSGYFTCDRWGIGSTTSGRLTMTQDTDAPSGFANCIKLDCTTADTSIGDNDKLTLRHVIEGQELQQFAKGTSDAKEFTVSFYVKGNASATYTCELYDSSNVRQISKTFSVTTAWTRVVLTYPADTIGAFNNNNATALYVQVFLHAGSLFTSGTLNSTSWASDTKANRVSSSGTSFFDSTNRTFQITGVKLEVGSEATDFQHISYGEELAKCHRYYFKSSTMATSFADAQSTGYSFRGKRYAKHSLPTIMRANPTVALIAHAANYSGGVQAATDVDFVYVKPSGTVELTGTLYWYGGFTADAEL